MTTSVQFSVFKPRTNSELEPRKNLDLFLEEAKSLFPYKEVNNWNDEIWDITDFEKKKNNSRGKRLRLIFAMTSTKTGKRTEPVRFDKIYEELIKGLVCIRYLERGVGMGPQQTILTAFRYLYQIVKNLKIEEVQNKHFVKALELIQSREARSTSYRIGNALTVVSKLLDRFYLTNIRTSFISSLKRTSEYDPLSERTSERTSKLMLSEDALEAILTLDKKIKNNDERLIVEGLKLLLVTGFRMSEFLNLERDCLLLKMENGEEFVGIKYFPMKGGHTKTRIKWFGDLAGKLVKDCVYKIQKLTLEAHETAKWLVRHEGKSYFHILFKSPNNITHKDFKAILNTDSNSAAYSFLIRNNIHPPYTISKFDNAFSLKEEDKIAFWDRKSGYKLHINKALFVILEDTFNPGKHKKLFAPEILRVGTFNLIILGKKGSLYSRKSLFEKYSIRGKNGEAIHITSHMFRRFLNTMYNEGGVPLTILSKIFGRKNSKDTLSYLYTTPKKRTEDARKLFKQGDLIGPKADVLRDIPIHSKDKFINTVVESIHYLEFGYCSHDWATLPCEKHIQCLDNCVDFHIDKNDSKSRKYLEGQIKWATRGLVSALAEIEDNTYGADTHADHYRRIIENAEKYLEDMNEEET